MIRNHLHSSWRTALRTVTGAALVSVAGCLNNDCNSGTHGEGIITPDSHGPLKRVAVEGTTFVVELSTEADVDQVNLIQPKGELFGQRDEAAGAQQVSFEIGTVSEPGEYRVVALKGEETVAENTRNIEPEIQIQDGGLYRHNPVKPWDEVCGESQTDSKKNGEAFGTIRNSKTGPDAVGELRVSGDIPNPIEHPVGSGIYEKASVVVPAGEAVDVFSDSSPFGSGIGDGGLDYSTEGTSGKFTIVVETRVSSQEVTKPHSLEYTSSDERQNCEITISEAY